MRTLGHIEHPQHKITVLSHNNKLTLQIENGLFSQSYSFRDGSPVSNMAEAHNFCNEKFLNGIDLRFEAMRKDYYDQIKENIEDDFPEIV